MEGVTRIGLRDVALELIARMRVSHERAADDASAPEQAPPTARAVKGRRMLRSEEHTSELQSQSNLVCRLLLEKKKNAPRQIHSAQVKTTKKTFTSPLES